MALIIPHQETITRILFVIFTGTAILSTIALYARQSLLVAYILLGMLLGPEGFKLIQDPVLIQQIGDVGVIFLLLISCGEWHRVEERHCLSSTRDRYHKNPTKKK